MWGMLTYRIFIIKEGKQCVLITGRKQILHHGQHCVSVCVCACMLLCVRETDAEWMDNQSIDGVSSR